MVETLKTAWRRRSMLFALSVAFVMGCAGFFYVLNMDEGTRLHIRKQIREASRMPGRLLT
jgi:hypothetical protein